jgi:hypothetical protein
MVGGVSHVSGYALGNTLRELGNDGGVGVEEIVTGHSGLAGDTSGDDDNLSVLDGGLELGIADVASDLYASHRAGRREKKDKGKIGSINAIE